MQNDILSLPYTVTPIKPKQVKLIRNTHVWDLSDDDPESFYKNPISMEKEGTVIDVCATALHRSGFTYYLEDEKSNEGILIDDCIDYIIPYTDPILTPRKLPEPPYDKYFDLGDYVLKCDVPGYITAKQALNGSKKALTIKAGKYSVFAKTDGMISLKLASGVNYWIDPKDNKSPYDLPPLPDWRKSFVSFRDNFGNIYPQYFMAKQDGLVIDLENKYDALKILKRQPILIRGWFKGPDGLVYGRPDECMQKNLLWYGVRKDNLVHIPFPEQQEQIEEPLVIDEPILKVHDMLISILPKGIAKVFDIKRKV